MHKRNSHCSWCGKAFTEGQAWPRTCAGCGNTSYLNPLPVAVLLLPVDGGLLVIRRGIEAGKGKLALPGGYINLGESWQQAAVRELAEETGISASAEEVTHFRVYSAPDGTVLIFGAAGTPRRAADLPAFVPTDETTERLVINEPVELAFPLHTRVVREWFRDAAAREPAGGPRVQSSA